MTTKTCKKCNMPFDIAIQFPGGWIQCLHDWQESEQPKYSPEQLEQIKRTFVTDESNWEPMTYEKQEILNRQKEIKMPIKFISEEEKNTENLTLHDVEEHQFFVSKYGQLCQKIDRSSYQVIAQHNGEPYAGLVMHRDEYDDIKKILPKIKKIEF